MITFRFSGRTPTPNTYRIGQETDQNAERLRFELPQIADGQTAQLYMNLPDGTPEVINITDGMANVSRKMTEQPGRIKAWVGILGGDNIAWNSELFYLDVGDLPPITEQVNQRYPTAIQEMMAALSKITVINIEDNALVFDIGTAQSGGSGQESGGSSSGGGGQISAFGTAVFGTAVFS